MIKITNGYDDREVTVTSRHVLTGQDGTAVQVAPGETVETEVDGDWQASLSTRARNPGEAALELAPVAKPANAAGEAEVLNDADDATVGAEIKDMVDNKSNLTSTGVPNLAALNTRLQDKGFNPVNADRRDALMPQPA